MAGVLAFLVYLARSDPTLTHTPLEVFGQLESSRETLT